MDWMLRIMMTVVVLLLIGLGFSVYASATSETFSLVKDDFKCISTHKTMTLMPVGKVMVPQYRDVCDEYRRVK